MSWFMVGRSMHWCAATGVDVEVVVSAAATGPRIGAAEELTPQQFFSLYAHQQGLAPEAATIG